MKGAICGAGLCLLMLAGLCQADSGSGSPAAASVVQSPDISTVPGREKPTDGVHGPSRGISAPLRGPVSRPIQSSSSEVLFTYDALGRVVEIVRPSGK